MATVPLPSGLKKVRHVPRPQVLIDGPVPLIDPKDPDSKQIQEVWTARARVFDLSKPEDVQAYEKVWQSVCDCQAHIQEKQTNWDPTRLTYVAFVLWADLTYVAPKA